MSGLRHSRRRVLGVTGAGLGATVLTGCGLFEDDPEPPKAPDPLQPLLDEALALAAAYDRATVTTPGLARRLTPLADDHRAHASELARVIGAPLPSTPAVPSEGTSSAGTSSAGTSSAGTSSTGTSSAGTPSEGTPSYGSSINAVVTAKQAISDLRKAEQTAQKTATAACREAPAERVALVGSIAACRATHTEALR